MQVGFCLKFNLIVSQTFTMNSEKVEKKKQKQKLLINGHYFIKLKDLKKSTKWCCDKKGTLKCKSIVKTCLVDGSYDIKFGPTEHNHEDPQNRKLIVATPRKSIVGKTKKSKYVIVNLDFAESSIASEQANGENKTNNTDTPQRAAGDKQSKRSIPYVDQPIEPDFGVQEIKFIKWGQSEHERLFIDGFHYSIKRIMLSSCDWVCSRQSLHLRCPARVVTIYASGAHKLKYAPDSRPHNHDKAEIPKMIRPRRPPVVSTESLADVSMHTQLMSRIPQTGIVEFPPPNDCEIKFAILFSLRRQMMPEQIFYELQSVYGLDAPSFDVVSEHCKQFKGGYYPTDETESRHRDSDESMSVSKIYDDPDMSREILTVQPDMNTSNIL